MKKGKVKHTEYSQQGRQKPKWENKSINIGQLLSYRDDHYCEVVRPTYTLFHLSVFFIVFILFSVITFFVVIHHEKNISDSLSFMFGITIFIMGITYFLLLLSKDFATHLKQAYYQPIVFNRKQQKIYIYYNDSKEKVYTTEILNMADVVPVIDVLHHTVVSNYKGRHERDFFNVRVCVEDNNRRRYPLFHHFYSTSFCYSVAEKEAELRRQVEDELAGYWNWCYAYMKYQDALLPTSKITKHFFRAKWPAHIRRQFMSDSRT